MLVGNATKPTDENGDSLPVSVATIAALRAYPIPTTDGYPVNELGYYAAGDGGGQPFTWSASSILDDDGGSVVAPNPLPPSGRWHRMAGPMSFAHFGAGLRNGSADDTARCNAAINAAFRTTGPAEATIRMQRGVYPVTGIDLFATGGYGLRIEGQGSGNSIFTHWGSGTGPILSLADDHDVHLESFGVQGTGKSGIGIKTTNGRFTAKHLTVSACDEALVSDGGVCFNFEHCVFSANARALHFLGTGNATTLSAFKDCGFYANDVVALFDKGDGITAYHCDFEGNAAGITVGPNFSSQTTFSRLTFDKCWWESNSGDILTSTDGGATYFTFRDCDFYNNWTGGKVSITGTLARVTMDNIRLLNRLEVTGDQTRIHLAQSFIYSWNLAVTNSHVTIDGCQTLHNLNPSALVET